MGAKHCPQPEEHGLDKKVGSSTHVALRQHLLHRVLGSIEASHAHQNRLCDLGAGEVEPDPRAGARRTTSRAQAQASSARRETACPPRLDYVRSPSVARILTGTSATLYFPLQDARLLAGQQRVSELPETAGISGNRRERALAQPSRTGTVGNGSGVLAMQKVEGSSPFIRSS